MNERTQQPRIMVVDDDPYTARNTAFPLMHVYRVEVVTLAEEALRRLDSMPAAYRLIFADLGMKPIGGEVIAALVKRDKRFQHVRVVAVSGDREVATRAAEAGFDDYLGKPYEWDEIVRLAWRFFPLASATGFVSCRKCGSRVVRLSNVHVEPTSAEWHEIRHHVMACPIPDEAA